MANHITNIITFENSSEDRLKEILDGIKNDDEGIGTIDFNKIVPTPPDIYQGNLGQEEMERSDEKNLHSFNIKNWGTKSNSFFHSPYNEGENVIEFCTAWSEPYPILLALSQKYPDVQIHHQYADDDLGYNVGERYYKDGQIISEDVPDGGSKQAYEMSARIQGYDLGEMGFQLNEDGATYEFKEIEPEPKEEKIKVVLIKPMQNPAVIEISNDLKTLQNTVGGNIEVLSLYGDCDIVCNDEGKNIGLPLNRAIRDEGEILDIIAGSFFICSAKGENFASLSEEQVKKYSELYKNPEQFYKINGEIKVVEIVPNKSRGMER